MKVSRRSAELTTALALVLVGTLYVSQAVSLPLGEMALPGPGVAPLALGIALAVIALMIAMNAVRNERRDEAVVFADVRVLMVFGALIVVAVLFEPLGAYPTLGLFTVTLLPLVARTSAARGVLAALLTVFAIWVVFRMLLGVQLPRGPL
jgi:hypothetical protein